MADISDDFYIDALIVLAGLCLLAVGFDDRDIVQVCLGYLIVCAGGYEMHQRITNF